MRATRRAAPLLCAFLVAAVSACSGGEPNTTDPPAPAVSSTPAPKVSPTPARTAASRPLQTRVTVVQYHCGYRPLKYNGKTWEVFNPNYYPPKWKGKGKVVLLTADHLRYRDDLGLELDFVLGDGEVPPCA